MRKDYTLVHHPASLSHDIVYKISPEVEGSSKMVLLLSTQILLQIFESLVILYLNENGIESHDQADSRVVTHQLHRERERTFLPNNKLVLAGQPRVPSRFLILICAKWCIVPPRKFL